VVGLEIIFCSVNRRIKGASAELEEGAMIFLYMFRIRA